MNWKYWIIDGILIYSPPPHSPVFCEFLDDMCLIKLIDYPVIDKNEQILIGFVYFFPYPKIDRDTSLVSICNNSHSIDIAKFSFYSVHFTRIRSDSK